MAITTILNCRVAGNPNYYPAHIPMGGQKAIRQRCEVPVFENDGDKVNKFRVTAFGKMADIVARSCGIGKQLGFVLTTHTYDGKVAIPGNAPGTPPNFVLKPDGQPMTITKTGHIITNISFGADSEKQEVSEIQGGFRPPMWNVKGHPDHQAWKDVCAQRNSTEFQAGMTSFGYATVSKPNGQIVTAQQMANANQQYAGNPAAVANGFNQTQPAAPGYQPQQNGNTAGGWGQAPQPNNPVYVHGQNVGFAMPNTPPQQSGWGQAPGALPAQGGYNQNMGYAPQQQGGYAPAGQTGMANVVM